MAIKSRLAISEEKRHIKKAYFNIGLIIIGLLFILFLGIPLLVRFAGFLGNLANSSQPVDINDITPPAPPRLDNIPEYTKDSSINIEGQTEEGATVYIYANGKVSEFVAGKDGRFSYLFKLNAGENEIYARANDTSGNEGKETQKYKIIFDNKEPKIEISSPENGQSFFGSTEKQITIKGSVDEKAEVFINDRFTLVKDDGSFTYSTTLSEGNNNFVVKATDFAGNESQTIELNFNFTP